MSDARYDPLDTVRWMLDDARRSVLSDEMPGAGGRPRRKTKARLEADRIRYETLCEVVWNIAGRTEPLDDLTRRGLAA